MIVSAEFNTSSLQYRSVAMLRKLISHCWVRALYQTGAAYVIIIMQGNHGIVMSSYWLWTKLYLITTRCYLQAVINNLLWDRSINRPSGEDTGLPVVHQLSTKQTLWLPPGNLFSVDKSKVTTFPWHHFVYQSGWLTAGRAHHHQPRHTPITLNSNKNETNLHYVNNYIRGRGR